MAAQIGSAEAYLKGVQHLIEAWKNETPGVVSQTLGTVTQPLSWLVNQVVPQSAIRAVIDGLDLAAKSSTTSRGSKEVDDLRSCDQFADQVINLHVAGAVAEGGAAGFFGIVALPVDIPAVVFLALRLIRQVGVEYGFQDDNEVERDFVLSVLAASGANTQKEKIAAVAVGSHLIAKLSTETWKAMAINAAAQRLSVDAAVIATKNLAKSVGYNLTKRKALEAIPLIGSAVGAATNGLYLRDVGVAAQRRYQERWLLERVELTDAKADADALPSLKTDQTSTFPSRDGLEATPSP